MRAADQEYTTLAVDEIAESLHNPRQQHNQLALDELTESVRAKGVIVPILVRMIGGKPEVVYGHRRLQAARAAGLTTIPAIVRELSDDEALELAIIENCTREDIHPLDEADAYKALLDQGKLAVEDLAGKVGKSKSHIYGRLRLTELAPPVRKAIVDDQITVGAALLFARLTPKRQVEALKQIGSRRRGDGPMGARDVAWDLKRYNHALKDAPFDVEDLTLLAAVGPCTHCPKRSGAQHDLFGNPEGEEPDLCTDPDCWDHKVANDWQRREKGAADAGVQVLVTKDVFGEYAGLKSGWVDAKTSPYEAHRLPRSRTWRQLVGKELKPSIVQHPETGATVEVYDAKAARKAIPDDIRKVMFGKSDAGAKPSRQASSANNLRKVNELVTKRYHASIVAQAGALTDAEVIRVLATAALDDYDVPEFCAALGWDADAKTTTDKRIAAASPQELRALATLPLALGYGPMVDLVKRELDVDMDKIQRQAKKDVDAEAKAEAAAKKAAKKAKGRSAKATPTAAIGWGEEKRGVTRGKGAAGRRYAVYKTKLGYNLENTGCNNGSLTGVGAGSSGPWESLAAAQVAALEHESQEAKAPPPKASKKTRTKPKRGTCRVCNCTEEHGCPEGCSWADKTKTICTSCVGG